MAKCMDLIELLYSTELTEPRGELAIDKTGHAPIAQPQFVAIYFYRQDAPSTLQPRATVW